MKKFLALTMALIMALALVACGSSAPASSAAPAASSEETAAEADAPAEGKQYIFSVDDLEGVTIGVQLGTTGDIYAGDVTDKVERFAKAADAVQALKTNKVDAVIIDNGPGSVFVAQNDDIIMLDEDFTTEDYAICISKENADLTAAFNGAIAEIKADGTLDAILDKYINGTEGAVGYVTPEGTEYPNGKLVMATNAYFPPYEYYADGSTEVIGIDAEVAKAICDKLGYELEIEDMEFDSIIAAVNSGKASFGAAGMTVTEDRLKNIDFTDSYSTGIQSVLVLK